MNVSATRVLGTESDPLVRSEATFQPLVTSVLNIRKETDTGSVHIHIPTYFTYESPLSTCTRESTERARTDRYMRGESATKSTPVAGTIAAEEAAALMLK